jgi:hypothetical protein
MTVDGLLQKFRANQIRLIDEPMARKAYEQLNALEFERTEDRVRYICRRDSMMIWPCPWPCWPGQQTIRILCEFGCGQLKIATGRNPGGRNLVGNRLCDTQRGVTSLPVHAGVVVAWLTTSTL